MAGLLATIHSVLTCHYHRTFQAQHNAKFFTVMSNSRST